MVQRIACTRAGGFLAVITLLFLTLAQSVMGGSKHELKAVVDEFRADEITHKKIALSTGAENAPAYLLFSAAVKTGSRLAIWLSERV